MAYDYKQGFFKPRFPKKYIGDPTNIVYRSGWELKLMGRLDNDPNVVQWSSEEIVIPYKSPVDGRWHRYFVDFYVKNSNGDVLLVEVKPYKQTKPPEKQSKITKKYITEVTAWGINEAKWKAATEYCLDRGWEFRLITEEHLGL